MKQFSPNTPPLMGTSFNLPGATFKRYLQNLQKTCTGLFYLWCLSFFACQDADQEVMEEASVLRSEKTFQLVTNIQKKVMHLNLCGNVCFQATHPESGGVDSRGSTSRMNKVLAAIDSYQPHAITFNEICYSQYRTIRTSLIARGYGGTYSSTTTGGSCDNYDASWGQGFGNAIFFLGTVPNVQQKYVLPNSSTAEPRQLLCTDVVLDGRTVKICTTHLSNEATWRTQQVQHIVNLTNNWIAAGTPVILTGDFNAQPMDSEMGLLYSHSGGTGKFQEADETNSCPSPQVRCRAGENTFNESKKLDYIFFSAAHFGTVFGDAKSRFPNPISDHNTFQGSAYWQ